MRSPRIALKPAAARGLKAWAALEGKEPTAILEGLVMANLPAKVKELLGEPGGQGLKEPMSPGLLEPGKGGEIKPAGPRQEVKMTPWQNPPPQERRDKNYPPCKERFTWQRFGG